MEHAKYVGELDKSTVLAKHFCNPGDLVAAMAGLKSYYDKYGRKIKLLQQLLVPANYYPSATHGTVDEKGVMVCMNQHIYDMIRPLVVSQEYIDGMEVYEGQEPIAIDIDVIRKKIFVNLPHGQIQAWIMYAYPDLSCDLSKPWITLPEVDIPIVPWIKDKIIINFTERYRNGHISYYFLKKYKHRLVFAGTEKEYFLFTNTWRLDIPLLQVKDFLELAYAIKNCKCLLANQSMNWGIADALKSPRILEICEYAVNCMPFVGENSVGFYHQEGVEYYCETMF